MKYLYVLLIVFASCSGQESALPTNKNSVSATLNRKSFNGSSARNYNDLTYFFKGSTGANIYVSNISGSPACGGYSESIGVLGNGVQSQYGPAATVRNDGTIYLFHKGNTNDLIYVTSSTNGVNWSSDIPLGNGAKTLGGVSATSSNGVLYVAYTSDSGTDNKIYVSASSDGVTWTETAIPVTNYARMIPWITGGGSGLLLCYAATSNLQILTSTDGINWSLFSNGPSYSGAIKGFSMGIDGNGRGCLVIMDGVLKVSYSSYLSVWSTPVTIKNQSGQSALSSERPVVTYDPGCSGSWVVVYKGSNNNNIYKAYNLDGGPGPIIEMGTFQGTTPYGPFIIPN